MPPRAEHSSTPSGTVISAELTKGMSLIEKLVVLLAAHASAKELDRIREFFHSYEPERHAKNPAPAKKPGTQPADSKAHVR